MMASLTAVVKAQCPPNAYAFVSQYPQCPLGCGVLLKDWPEGVVVNVYGGAPLSVITSAIIPGTYGGPGIGNAFVCVPCNVQLVFASTIPGATNGCVIINLGVVPVRLNSFDVQTIQQNNRFRWTVSNETGGVQYIIQESTDGVHFADKMVVPGNGGSTKSYQYQLPVPDQQSHQYRLKIVEITGSTSYSETVLVKAQSQVGFTVYPNPVLQDFSLSIAPSLLPATVQVVGAQGQLLYQATATQSITKIQKLLPAGVYAVRVTGNNNITTTQTLIKK